MTHRTLPAALGFAVFTVCIATTAQAQSGPPAQAPSPTPWTAPATQPATTELAPIAVQPVSVQGAPMMALEEPQTSRGSNIALESLAGFGGFAAGGIAGGLVGMGVGFGIDSAASSCGGPTGRYCGGFGLGGAIIGLIVGTNLVAPLGAGLATYGAGRAMGGNGRLGYTILGAYLGWASGLAVAGTATAIGSAAGPNGASAGAAIGGILGTIVAVGGPVLAYELDHRNVSASMPVVRPSAAGTRAPSFMALPYASTEGVGLAGFF